MPSLSVVQISTVGQRRWRTAVSHLPTWRPPKQANKARPGLVFYNRRTLTYVYTQIDMGKSNSVPENRDLQSLNFVTRTLCILGGEVEDSFSKQRMRWRTLPMNEMEDSLGGGELCTWQRSQVLKWKQLLFALYLYLHSLNCVSFENSIFICLISWCLVTLLSFGT